MERKLGSRSFWLRAVAISAVVFLHRRFIERPRRDPDGTFALITRLHWILLVLSLITIAGAVAGSHGYLLFTQ